jgi:hypothetical protein
MLRLRRPVILLAACLLSGSVLADGFLALDPRSMSMGGAGVASTRPYNAAFFNPARLAGNPPLTNRRSERAFVRPFLGARLIDRDGFLDALDHYQENDARNRFRLARDELQDAIQNAEVEMEDFRRVTRTGNELIDDFENLSDKPLRVVASAGVSFGAPGEHHGYGFHVRQNALGGTRINVADSDLAQVRTALNFLDTLLDTYELREIPTDIELPSALEDPVSDAELQGALIRETGFSFAMSMLTARQTVVGVTFKSLYVETLDWRAPIGDFDRDNFSLDEQRIAHTDGNIDIGLTHALGGDWTVGLMVRNAIAREYETVRGNSVPITPTVRAGLAWQTDEFTVAWDMDVNESPAIGFDPNKQFIATGVEYRPWGGLALRAGFRYERVLGEGTTSFGLGWSAPRFHVDFALAGAARDDRAIALQTGVRF